MTSKVDPRAARVYPLSTTIVVFSSFDQKLLIAQIIVIGNEMSI